MAISADVSFVQGEDVIIQDSVIDANDAAVNITGWALEFALSARRGATPTLTKTVGSGITITNGAGGVFEVALSDTDTDALTPGDYFWDVKRTDAGSEAVLTRGKCTVLGRVSAA